MKADTDQELLELLGRAFAPPPLEPSPIDVMTLRQLVVNRAALASTSTIRPHRPPLTRLAIAATVAALGLGASAVAYAVGAPAPRPLEAAAHSFGLPVDSPALIDAKDAVVSLRAALGHADNRQVGSDAAVVRERLAALGTDERQEIDATAQELLHEADQRLQEPDNVQIPGTGPSGPQEPSAPETRPGGPQEPSAPDSGQPTTEPGDAGSTPPDSTGPPQGGSGDTSGPQP